MNGGLEFYKNASFNVNGNPAEADTTVSGSNYPVRDTCMKKNDPEEKCVLTEGLYYKSFVSLSSGDDVEIKITSDELGNVVNKRYASTKEEFYTASDLGCSKDT